MPGTKNSSADSADDGGSIHQAPLATNATPETTPTRPYVRIAPPPENLSIEASVAGERGPDKDRAAKDPQHRRRS